MKTGTTVESGSGLMVDIMRPSLSQVTVVDIVHSLAMTPRFLGAITMRYSQAQHLLLMHDLFMAYRVSPAKLFLNYFVSRSHIAVIGDIPPALQNVLHLRAGLSRIMAKLHECTQKHLVTSYGVSESAFYALSNLEDAVRTRITALARSYESFHLMQSGGWSMQLEPHLITAAVKELFERSKYRFEYSEPPKLMDEKFTQVALLARLKESCWEPAEAAQT